MKKLFLLFATVTLLVGVQACKQKEEAAEEATETVTTETVTTETTTVTDSATAAANDTSRDIKNPTTPQ
jgi:uncharacterized protein YcfL